MDEVEVERRERRKGGLARGLYLNGRYDGLAPAPSVWRTCWCTHSLARSLSLFRVESPSSPVEDKDHFNGSARLVSLGPPQMDLFFFFDFRDQ